MSPSGDDDSPMSTPRRRLLLFGAVALLAALTGCGEPQPVPTVCHGCSDEEVGRALPPNATTGESVTHLYLNPGTGAQPRVVSRTDVDSETAAELRRNASRREAVREAVLATRDLDGTGPGGQYSTPSPVYEAENGRDLFPVPVFEARDLSVGMEGDTLVVDFRVAGIPDVEPEETLPLVERGPGGAVLVDQFNVRDGRNPHPGNEEGHTYRLATDRLVIHAPPGTRPVVTPENATVRGNSVVLRSLPADTNLVFAPSGAGGTLAAHATLTADTLGWVIPDAFWVALLPALQLSLLLGGLRAGERSGAQYAVAALLLALVPTLGIGLVGLVGVAAGLVVSVAGYLLWRARWGRDDDAESAEGSDASDEPAEGRVAGDASTEASDAGEDSGWRHPTLASLRAGVEPWVEPVAVVAVIATVLTVAAAVLAGDTPVPGLLFLSGGVLPVFGIFGLGRLEADDADRPRRYRLLVLTVLVAPWLFAVGHVAGRDMPDSVTTLVLVLVWGSGVTLVGFVAYWFAANAVLRPGKEAE